MADDRESLGIREICREMVLGFVFWSLFGGLAPMIWFYPLNAMEVSGYEVFLLVIFSPVLLGSVTIRKLVQTRIGLGLLRLITVASLGSFQAPDTLTRLKVLGIGNFSAFIVLTATLWSPSARHRYVTYCGLMLGYFAYLVSRIWYTSYLPTWYDNTSNTAVISLAAMATIDQILAGNEFQEPEKPQPSVKHNKSDQNRPPWIRISIGFSSLLFLTFWIFGDVSVVSRWGLQPYPDTGPMPYPWGMCVLVAIFVGLTLSPQLQSINRLVWWLAAVASLLSLYYLESWSAFAGGLVLGVFTMSLWPAMTEKLATCPPGRTMALVAFSWIVILLHEIWTVAFNFVPGGVFTREHTDHLIVIVMLGIALGYFTDASKIGKFTECATTHAKITKVLLVMLFVGAGGFVYRYNKQFFIHPPKVHPKADFSAGVWAFHFGYDNKGWPSVVPSSDFIKDSGVDVIGLLETDASKPFLGNNDLSMWLSERLGMYSDFGAPTRDHCWGVALLSKYPIVKSQHHLLPSPHGELAPAILATVNMTGHLVDFLVTHMGNDWDVLDRKLQATALADLMRNAENPVVFLGYVTSKPDSRDYKCLINDGKVKDIDDTDRKRFCEYIMYKGLIRLGYARVTHAGLSDTELQMAKFRIPETPKTFVDHEVITTDPTKVDKNIRFNKKFGEYRDGHSWQPAHKFHMSTPKYFIKNVS